MEHVTCTKCKESKPATTEFFHRHKKKANGFDSWCRACHNEYLRGILHGRYRKLISDEDLRKMIARAKSCAICKELTNLVLDHDHVRQRVRGMLCQHCNRGLGHFRDQPRLLLQAAKYLKKHRDKP